jgi:NAD(P)-dependent dehydrogenase (short-subunit alcohol dehydrogenase family)
MATSNMRVGYCNGSMTRELRGQIALVTGGSRGIGFGIAEALVGEGVRVAITGRDAKALADAKRRLEADGGIVETLALDVRDYDAVAAGVETVASRLNGLDIVVNNAGIGNFANVADMRPSQWAEVIDTNLTGVFNVCSAVLPRLRDRGGYIINISSLAGKNPFVGGSAYCASKAALNSFTAVLMQEVRHYGIKVTTIAPGSVATGFSGNDENQGADWKISPADIGAVVVGLLRMDPRSLSSYIEMRPSQPPRK